MAAAMAAMGKVAGQGGNMQQQAMAAMAAAAGQQQQQQQQAGVVPAGAWVSHPNVLEELSVICL